MTNIYGINHQKRNCFHLFIQVVGIESEKVGKEKAFADTEEEKVTVIEIEVTKKATDCANDLAKAEPALVAAQEALNTLNKVGPQVLILLQGIYSSAFCSAILTCDGFQRYTANAAPIENDGNCILLQAIAGKSRRANALE